MIAGPGDDRGVVCTKNGHDPAANDHLEGIVSQQKYMCDKVDIDGPLGGGCDGGNNNTSFTLAAKGMGYHGMIRLRIPSRP